MIWILTTCLILRRCQSPYYRHQQQICPCAVRIKQVAPFLLPSIYQISTLEKTNSCQHSTLSSLMSQASLTSLTVLRCCSVSMGSEEIDFRVWFSPGLSDAVEGSTTRVLSLHRETKFIIDFDFAVTLSSPESFCFLFDITSEQLVELKWLMLNKHKKMIPFITCEISLGQYVCELVFGVNVFDLGSKLIRSNNQSRATQWVFGRNQLVGNSRTSQDDASDKKNMKQQSSTRRLE